MHRPPSDNTGSFKPDDSNAERHTGRHLAAAENFALAAQIRAALPNLPDHRLQIPPAGIIAGELNFRATNPNSLSAMLGLENGRPVPSADAELHRLFDNINRIGQGLPPLELGARLPAGKAGERGQQPATVPTADAHWHARVFEAARVRPHEGAYQVAQRLLGDNFTHKETMQLVRALQTVYRDEINSGGAGISARQADMSDLRAGHGLLRADNFHQVMDALRTKNPRLAERVQVALAEDRQPRQPADGHRRPGSHYHGADAADRWAIEPDHQRRGQRQHERGQHDQLEPHREQRGGAGNDGRRRHDESRRRERVEPTPHHASDDHSFGGRAMKLVRAAQHMADVLHMSGKCSKGVRLALQHLGFNFHAPHAVAMGRVLERSGHFERHDIPISQARPGDIIVRDWNTHVQRAKGYNHGDIVVVTGKNSNGTLRGANDHHWASIPPDGGRYKNSYVLRLVD